MKLFVVKVFGKSLDRFGAILGSDEEHDYQEFEDSSTFCELVLYL